MTGETPSPRYRVVIRVADLLVASTLAIVLVGLVYRHDDNAVLNYWTWDNGSPSPRFVLVIGEANWSTITLGVAGNLREQLADDRVHRTVDTYLNSALRLEADGCAAHYILDKVAELPDRSLLAMGHCIASN